MCTFVEPPAFQDIWSTAKSAAFFDASMNPIIFLQAQVSQFHINIS